MMRLVWRVVMLLAMLGSVTFPAEAVSFVVGGVRVRKPVKTLKEIKLEHVVPQSLDVSCGPAGLATLFNYFLNDPVTETEIIEFLLQTTPLEKVRDRRGFSLLDLKNFARARGYVVTGYKMDIVFLSQHRSPVLVPISFKNYRHFVVVRGVVGDRVFLADPAMGNISMKLDKFESIWLGGIGLVIDRPRTVARKRSALKVAAKDLRVADHRMVRGLVSQMAVRTAVYPGEF